MFLPHSHKIRPNSLSKHEAAKKCTQLFINNVQNKSEILSKVLLKYPADFLLTLPLGPLALTEVAVVEMRLCGQWLTDFKRTVIQREYMSFL